VAEVTWSLDLGSTATKAVAGGVSWSGRKRHGPRVQTTVRLWSPNLSAPGGSRAARPPACCRPRARSMPPTGRRSKSTPLLRNGCANRELRRGLGYFASPTSAYFYRKPPDARGAHWSGTPRPHPGISCSFTDYPCARRVGDRLGWSLDRPWPDQPDDHHQDSAAHAAVSDLTDNRADIKSACSSRLSPRSAAQQRPYDLRPYPAADHTESLPRARREDPDSVRRQRARSHRAPRAPGFAEKVCQCRAGGAGLGGGPTPEERDPRRRTRRWRPARISPLSPKKDTMIFDNDEETSPATRGRGRSG